MTSNDDDTDDDSDDDMTVKTIMRSVATMALMMRDAVSAADVMVVLKHVL